MHQLFDRRVIFVGGKGGVGKTTTAGALALMAGEVGRKTLLVSTDPAHSIGDVFDVQIGNEETPLGPNVWGLEIDPEQTNVVLVSEDGQQRETLFNVPNVSGCTEVAGWYFDTPTEPTMVHLCPSACGAVSGTVEIEFGCETVKY